jgi:hypothetical protein
MNTFPNYGVNEVSGMLCNRADELLSFWEARRESGQPVTAEELCAESPELLEEVRWAIHALEQVESRFGVPSSSLGRSAEAQPSNRDVSGDFTPAAGLGECSLRKISSSTDVLPSSFRLVRRSVQKLAFAFVAKWTSPVDSIIRGLSRSMRSTTEKMIDFHVM